MGAAETHPDALAVMQKIARYPEGRVALAKMIRDELRQIQWHMSGVIARCAAHKAKEQSDGSR